MKLSLSLILCWAFALWWLSAGIRDAWYVTYGIHHAETRYRNVVTLLIALAASVELGLLGYWLSVGSRKSASALYSFALTWAAWVLVATWLKMRRPRSR